MDIPKFEDVFGQIKTNLWLAGIPFDNLEYTFRYYLFFFSVILLIAEEFSFFISKISSENFLVLVDLAPCVLVGMNTILKYALISFKRQKIYNLATSLETLYEESIEDAKKVEKIYKSNVNLKKLVRYYLVLNFILISVYTFSTLTLLAYHYYATGEIEFYLPYPILTPFSINTWPKWLVAYLHSVISGYISVLYFTTVDALYCILTSHLCSNFVVLSEEIILLDKNTAHKLPCLVKRHQEILKLAEDLEEIFSLINLCNVLVGSLNICVLGFNLTAGDLTRMPGFILFLTSVLLQILMMSVFGENLLQESTKVGDSAFFCKWYEMDNTHKKIVLIIILRSSKPQRLTAYKFSTIGHGSFTKIISTSWSYFTILRTAYKHE